MGYWDADLATPLAAIADLCEILERQPEVQIVTGARVQLLGRAIRRRLWRHMLGRVFASAVCLAFRLPAYDTQCGAKLFRVGPAARRLFDEPFHSRWLLDVELLARFLGQPGMCPQIAARQIFEFPLQQWTDMPRSKVTAVTYLRAMVEFVNVYWVYCRRKGSAQR